MLWLNVLGVHVETNPMLSLQCPPSQFMLTRFIDRKCRQVKQGQSSRGQWGVTAQVTQIWFAAAKPRDNLERLMPAGLKNTYASGTHSGVIGVGQGESITAHILSIPFTNLGILT